MATYKSTTTSDGQPVFIKDDPGTVMVSGQPVETIEAVEVADKYTPDNPADDVKFCDLFEAEDQELVMAKLKASEADRQAAYDKLKSSGISNA